MKLRQTRVLYAGGMLGLIMAVTTSPAGELMTIKGYQHVQSDYQLVNEEYDEMPGTFISPHIKWATGNTYRKMRVLTILPTWASREVIELKERFPANMSVIMTHSHKAWATNGTPYAESRPERLERISMIRLNRPEPYDVIIIGKMSWKAIPDHVQQLIMKRVSEGTGLIYVSPANLDERLTAAYGEKKLDAEKEAITSGIPLSMLPLEDKQRPLGPLEIRLAQIGQGRVVFLDYQDMGEIKDFKLRSMFAPYLSALTPLVPDDELFYDYYHALLARSILWASRKGSDIHIQVKGDGASLARNTLPTTPITFEVKAELNAKTSCSFHYELRNSENEVVLSGDAANELKKSAEPVAFSPQLPKLPQGIYVLDMWVKQGEETLAWASGSLTITGEDWITVQTDKEAFPRGTAITGAIRAAKDLPKDSTLRVELTDTWQRLVEQQTLRLKNGEAKFAFDVKFPLSRIYFISAILADKSGVIQSKRVFAGMPDRTVDDYFLVIWATGMRNRIARIVMEQCKRHNVGVYYDGVLWQPECRVRESSEILAKANLLAQPYTEHLTTGHWQKTIEEEKTRYGEECLFNGKTYGRFGTMTYSICEENVLVRDNKDYENPKTLPEYRDYMKKQFGTLEKMNAIWNSDYKSWDDLHMIEMGEAKIKNRFPQYVSQELYKQDRFMTIHEFAAAQIRKEDPGTRISIDIPCPGYDMDFGRLAEFVNGGWAIGEFTYFLMYRSDTIYGEGGGYNTGQLEEFRMRFWPWKGLFQGGRMMFWWPVGFSRGLGGACAFTPDASEPVLCYEQMRQEVQRIQNGIGKLLIQGKKVKDPILVLYSNISAYAALLNNKETNWGESRGAFYSLFDKIGLTYRAISGKELVALQYGPECKVLVLPYCQAMPRAEVEAVKKFVEQGGLVIADYNPAIFDEYCRPYGKAEVLKPGEEKECNRCGGKGRYEEATATVTAWQTCPRCGGTGKVMDGREVQYTGSALLDVFGSFEPMKLNSIGKGKALYLGQTLTKSGDWDGLALLLEKHAGVRRPFQVKNKAGGTRHDSFTAAFEYGHAKFFCLLGEKVIEAPDEDTLITLDKPYHVYDALRQTYLGFTNTVQIGVAPAGARVLAGLPCKLEGMKVEVNGKNAVPGKEVRLTAQVGQKEIAGAGLCLRFDVLDPEGNRMEAYSKKVTSDTGSFELIIPLALNEKPGRYTVKIEEIISGIQKTVEFMVSEK